MSVLEGIVHRLRSSRLYWVLLDPDDYTPAQAAELSRRAEDAGVDSLLVGGSLLHRADFDDVVASVKDAVGIPVLLFPGDAAQLSCRADAVLFLSLLSGRNPANLIGEHVKAAPIIKRLGIEAIPTAYLLVDSGSVSSVEFMSDTRPLPRGKVQIAAAHALAAQYLGMRLIYLETGSGAPRTVPPAMVRCVKSEVSLPLIVGGGIRNVAAASSLIEAGADIIVTGNLLKRKEGLRVMRAIARLIR